jgi:hypothetical protein
LASPTTQEHDHEYNFFVVRIHDDVEAAHPTTEADMYRWANVTILQDLGHNLDVVGQFSKNF